MLGQIVVNNQRIHAVVHEPFAHRRARERHEILVGRRIRRGGHDDNRVRHGAGFLQNADDARDVRLLLADGNVNAIQRTIICVSGLLRSQIEPRVVDDGVNADGRLARRTVADNQFTLAAANRNHRVNRHDARLHRLADGFAFDDARRDFFDRIRDVALDRAFAVQRLAEGIDDAAQQAFADRHLEQFAGGADLVTFLDAGVIAENDRAHLGFFEVQRQAGDAVAEIKHLVEHRVGQALNLGHAVADFADNADVLFGRRGLGARNLGFNFLQ